MAAGQVLTAGRSESNDIAVEHPTVSRRHIELRVNEDGSYDVIDLGASAGTFVFHNGQWTKFGHATVASDERLRLGSFETTAGALFEMAGGNAGGTSGEPLDEDSATPTEDIHEVTTHRRGKRTSSQPEHDAGESEHTTQRKSDSAANAGSSKKGSSKKGSPKKEPQTVKLPAGHASSQAKRGPAARPAPPADKPEIQPAAAAPGIVSPGKAPTDAPEPGSAASDAAPKSLAISYLLWFFLGSFGAHRFYLGSIGIGATQAALLVVGAVPVAVFGGQIFDKVLPTIFALAGVALLTCLLVWIVVDAFLIPSIVSARRGKPGGGN